MPDFVEEIIVDMICAILEDLVEDLVGCHFKIGNECDCLTSFRAGDMFLNAQFQRILSNSKLQPHLMALNKYEFVKK